MSFWDDVGGWAGVLNPFNARNPATLPLRAATWVALQVPALVGTGLTALASPITHKSPGEAFATYEQNLNAGLGFTDGFNGPINPFLSGNTNKVPNIDVTRIGDSIGGGTTLFFEAGAGITKEVIKHVLPPWLIPAAVGIGAVALLGGKE